MNRTNCAYCGDQEAPYRDCLIPNRGCISSDIHNTVPICGGCKASKGDKDLLEWWGADRIEDLHPAVRRKYLRMVYLCHECRGLLDQDVRYRELDLSDLAQVFRRPCYSFRSLALRDAARSE